VTIGVIILEP
jgi:hypothetical protein